MATDKYWQKDSITGAPVVALPVLTSTVDRVPPYGGALPVPPDAIGRMRLLAIADISQGRLGRKTVFDEILVTVQPAAELLSIDFETEKPLQLGRSGQSSAYGHVDSLGKIFELAVVGEFADGITREIGSSGKLKGELNKEVDSAIDRANSTTGLEMKLQPGGILVE
jgi:hypothetical protein